jgi:hypothetical protein
MLLTVFKQNKATGGVSPIPVANAENIRKVLAGRHPKQQQKHEI